MASAQRSDGVGGGEPTVLSGNDGELQKARSQGGGGENPFEALAEGGLESSLVCHHFVMMSFEQRLLKIQGSPGGRQSRSKTGVVR